MSIQHWRSKQPRLVSHWEDFADWLNRVLTVIIVLVLGLCMLAYMHLVRPFSCYLPETISVANQRYITETCWTNLMVENTNYYTPYETIKWVPTYVLISIAGFYLPHTLWQHIAELLIDSVVKLMMRRLEIALDRLDKCSLDQATTDVANHLVQSIMVTQLGLTKGKQTAAKIQIVSQLSFVKRLQKGKMRIGIPWLRFFIKALYVVNVNMQIMYARQLSSRISFSGDTVSLANFPILSTCRPSVLKDAGTIQCTLVGNLVLRESCQLYCSWLWLVMIVTVLYLLFWIFGVIFSSCRRLSWIKQRLLNIHACQQTLQRATPCSVCQLADSEHDRVHTFVHLLTQTDGVAMLELIDRRAGSDVADQILLKSWHSYVNCIESPRPGTCKEEPEEMQRFMIDESTA